MCHSRDSLDLIVILVNKLIKTDEENTTIPLLYAIVMFIFL
jgi:hypothetical protein